MTDSYFPIREYTCKLLEAVDEGIIDAKAALEAALVYMSESSVKDMCEVNCFFEYEEDDGQPDEAQEWADYDSDC